MEKLKNGGLSLIDPEAVTKGLMVIWVIKAYEGGKSNMNFLIQIIL